MARGAGPRGGGRRRHRRAFALAAATAVGAVVVLALAFRLSAADPPGWFGSPAAFFACVAGLVAVPTFVALSPSRVGTDSLLRRSVVATLGGLAGATLVVVAGAAMRGTYDPGSVPLWLTAAVGGASVAVGWLVG